MLLSRHLSAIRVAPLVALVVLVCLYKYPYYPARRPPHYLPTSFDWRNFSQRYPVFETAALPIGEPRQLRPVQYAFRDTSALVQNQRRDAVRAAFSKSWESYKKYAWGADELMPVTAGRKDSFGGYAATLVDALDMLWIMGFKKDFRNGVMYVAGLDWMNTTDTALNLFETTIRHLGGLLSAYDLSEEPVLLDKAVELGNMLLVAFDTPNRIPGFWLNFEDARNGKQMAGTSDPSAAPASLSLEFTRLAQLTGNNKYYDAVRRVTLLLARTQDQSLLPGMWPSLINFRDELLSDNRFSLGALGDSLYEYLPKMYALTGGLEPMYEKLYRVAMDTVQEQLLFRPMIAEPGDVLFAGTVFVEPGTRVPRLDTESEHLSCFAGGMFGLGGQLLGIQHHVDIGERLARGCAWGYSAFPTGLLPEIFGLVACPSSADSCPWDDERWRFEAGGGGGDQSLPPKGFKHARDPRYILRPEAVESLFLMWRMTGKAEYRDDAWAIFEAIQKATETEYAYSAIVDVQVTGETEKSDSMESFWLSETLKYLYLIFSSPDDIHLDEYVFNTEAHPLRRPVPGTLTRDLPSSGKG